MITPTTNPNAFYGPYNEKLRAHYEEIKLITDNLDTIISVNGDSIALNTLFNNMESLLALNTYSVLVDNIDTILAMPDNFNNTTEAVNTALTNIGNTDQAIQLLKTEADALVVTAGNAVTNAMQSATLSQAWAEGIEPAGIGTKSSKEYAEESGLLVNTALSTVNGVISTINKHNLFNDGDFLLSGGDRTYTINDKELVIPHFTNLVWSGDVTPLGTEAWKYDSSLTELGGFSTWFNDDESSDPVNEGDFLSIGSRVYGETIGGTLGYAVRFVDENGAYVGSQITNNSVATGEVQILKIENVEVPVGAKGILTYFFDNDPTNIYIKQHWVVKNSTAGDSIPLLKTKNQLKREHDNLREVFDDSSILESIENINNLIDTNNLYNLFPDAFFKQSANDKTFTYDEGHLSIYTSSLPNITWQAEEQHSYGTGAWKFLSGSSGLAGFVTDFTSPFVKSLTNINEGDKISFGFTVKGDIGKNIRIAGRYFNGTSGNWVSSQSPVVEIVADGKEQVVVVEAFEAPANATGFSAYVYTKASNATDILITSYWLVKGDYAGNHAPLNISDYHINKQVINNSLSDTNLLVNPTPYKPITTPRLLGIEGTEMSVYLKDSHSGQGKFLYDLSGNATIGIQQDDRLLISGDASYGPLPLTVNVLDPNNLNIVGTGEYAVTLVPENSNTGETRSIIYIGDSTTANGYWQQRVINKSLENNDSVQLTQIGTVGNAPNVHEGRGGWTIDRYYQPVDVGVHTFVSDNPFVENAGDKFDFAYYLTNTGQTAPDMALIHLGINDVFGLVDDASVNSRMDSYLSQMDDIIGVTTNTDVGSLKESNNNIKTIIAVPISPSSQQNAFGNNYNITQNRGRYIRNITIAAHRIIEHYKDSESDGIFLMPWNIAIDPENGWTVDVNGDHDNGVHPDPDIINGSGYRNMGDMAYGFINALVALNLA